MTRTPLNDVGLCEVADEVILAEDGTVEEMVACSNDAIGVFDHEVEGQTLENKLCKKHADRYDAEWVREI